MINTSKTYINKSSKQFTLFILGLLFFCIIFLSFSFFNFKLSTKSISLTYERITVQQGDTLWGLAEKLNSHVDTNTLVNKTIRYNNLSSIYIQPGQIIYVPVKS